MNIGDLDKLTLAELRDLAKKAGVKDETEYQRNDLVLEILKAKTLKQGYIFVEGILDIVKDNGHGVLRDKKMKPSRNDVYISSSQIKKFNLKEGDLVYGQARLPKDNEKYLSLLKVEAVNGKDPSLAVRRRAFEDLTPVYPNKIMKLETKPEILSTRIIDMLAPIGYGQRAMIVAPPKAGKTTLLKEIANGITENNPDVHVIVLLVAERPEEVTDMERSVVGEVISSNFDETPDSNVQVTELTLARAKRLVEAGENVAILMDSITRLARAYNIVMPTSGKTLTGGFDPAALYPPKKFFGAARNFEEQGSLTIIATALVDTGSRMDDVVFEEFKGTGNMELHLNRKLQERRVFPSIDLVRSSTRKEELLLPSSVLKESWRIRKMLETFPNPEDGIIGMLDRMKKTKSNEEFLATLSEGVQ
jgi:transcription termination factor Rho